MLFYAYPGTDRFTYQYFQYQLVPFKTLIEFLGPNDHKFITIVYNLLGNIVVFIPIGFLFLCTYPQSRKKMWIIFSVSYVFVVESIQFISKRGVWDIDDIILNTIGILLGIRIAKWMGF
jgi:glycopeptide antibiotics resistance protein